MGWAPKYTAFEDGLAETIAWYRDNESWWRPLKDAVESTYGEPRPVSVRELESPGAWELSPKLHADSRGVFFEWFTDASFRGFAGHRFDLAQANCSVSAAGVLRGVHFAQVPPSQAKYVTCVHGSVLDVVVDIRVGSPTFGQWDSVLLDDRPAARSTSRKGSATRSCRSRSPRR